MIVWVVIQLEAVGVVRMHVDENLSIVSASLSKNCHSFGFKISWLGKLEF